MHHIVYIEYRLSPVYVLGLLSSECCQTRTEQKTADNTEIIKNSVFFFFFRGDFRLHNCNAKRFDITSQLLLF
jgi:hypothetical protein